MAAGDLTTIANVEQWLGLPAGCKDEALLTRLITAASGFISRWCGRQFASQNVVDTFNGTGGVAQPLRQYPVSAVASVSVDGQSIPPSPGVPQAGFLFTDTMVSLSGYRFNRGIANVTIAYTAGYATIPDELEQACIELVAFRYREIPRIGKASEGMAAQTTAFVIKDIPPSVATLLATYKRVVPA
ncbi:MAG: hypothetical protein M0006_03335 [Magnetospirillum sp.]|nr:hypothetical protein [Magnetospirillum sp.]